MKFRCLLIILFVFVLNLLQAQTDHYKFEFQEAPLEKIFKYLEVNHDLLFSYRLEDIKNVQCRIEVNTSSLEEVMQQLLGPTFLDFEIADTRYVLIKKKAKQKDLSEIEKPIIHLCGKIVDAVTKEVLPYSNIFIEGTSIGTSSAENGKFTLSHHFEKDESITISYMGYEEKVLPWQELKSVNCITIEMDYSTFGKEFIIVTDYLSDGVDLVENGAATKLSMRRLGSLPGQIETNVLEVAQFLPGVSSPSGKAGDLYIRGCTPDQNLIVWENIPIYHSAHYFGMISAFNPFIIEEMKVYRGGFGAEYGGRIAGVITLKSGDEKTKESYFGGGANMTHAYLYGHQKIKTSKPSAISFSVRRSFSELLRTPTFNNITKINQQGLLLGNMEVDALPDHIKITDDFNFTDAHLKYSISLSDRDRLAVAGVFAKNNFVDEIVDNKRREGQRDTMDLKNRGISLNWQRQWNPRLQTKIIAVNNLYDYNYSYQLKEADRPLPKLSGIKANRIEDTQLHVSAIVKNDKQQAFDFGYQVVNYDIKYQVEEHSNRSEDINDQGQSSSRVHTLYGGFKNPISNKIGIDIGLRSSWYEAAKAAYFEPRIRLAYQLNKSISFHTNYGRHYQFISQVSVFRGNNNGISSSIWSLTTPGIPVIKSDLYQAGVVFEKKGWVVDLQAYQREIDGLSSRSADVETALDTEPIIGKANIKGIDLLIKKRFQKVRSWVSYSLSKATFNFPKLQANSFLADYDQRHVLQWTNQINIKQFEFGVGFKYSSGVPYSAIIDFEMIPGPENTLPNFTVAYDGIHNNNLPAKQEINCSILYKIQPKLAKNWRGFLSFSLSNILNKENINNRTYYLDTEPNQPASIQFLDTRSLQITPNLSLRIEW